MSPKSSRPRPVLMVPIRRCGSHALRLRLNFSSDFYSPYPLHIVDFLPLVPLYGDLADDDAYFRMIVDVVSLQAINMVKWQGVNFEPADIFDAIAHERRNVHRIVWELLFQAGMMNDARVVMDKSLDSVYAAGELVELFDDFLFLNVVRDPRAQVNSMTRAIIHDFDVLPNAQAWARAHNQARKIAQTHPQKVLTIRYEDFVDHQEPVLRKVCDFFGLDFLSEMLDVSLSREAKKIAGMSALWQTNASAPVAANVDKFKKELSMEEIEVIESVAGELMDYYGYERITRGTVSITAERQRTAQDRSAAEKLAAWERLRAADRRDWEFRRLRNDFLAMTRHRLERDRDVLPVHDSAGGRQRKATSETSAGTAPE
ncbi:MAG: sulfotransferase [Myxococcales bacterium]|nr:sulfotransferase [Myxococcales bacterium]